MANCRIKLNAESAEPTQATRRSQPHRIAPKMNKEKSWKNLVDSNQSTGNAQANIELSISARNLINLDLLSKSDPQCVV